MSYGERWGGVGVGVGGDGVVIVACFAGYKIISKDSLLNAEL